MELVLVCFLHWTPFLKIPTTLQSEPDIFYVASAMALSNLQNKGLSRWWGRLKKKGDFVQDDEWPGLQQKGRNRCLALRGDTIVNSDIFFFISLSSFKLMRN